MVREVILNIMADGNMIIIRIGKIKKAMTTTKKKKSKQDLLPTGTNNKNAHIVGDSIVIYVEEWKLKNSLGNNYNVYVRFVRTKIKCMNDYVTPCIRENNPEYVTLQVGTNELNFELTPERIVKSVIDVIEVIEAIDVKIFKPTIELSAYPV